MRTSAVSKPSATRFGARGFHFGYVIIQSETSTGITIIQLTPLVFFKLLNFRVKFSDNFREYTIQLVEIMFEFE